MSNHYMGQTATMRPSRTTAKNRLPAPLPGKDGQRAGDASEGAGGAANSTADRAIDILMAFSEDKPAWSTAEIAAHFGMPRSTTYRYLNSLRSYALIVED